jgi:PAS domain-containing protein
MINQPLDVLFPEESRLNSLKKFERVIKGEEQWENVEIPILRKDGEIRIGLWNSANIYSNGNNRTLIATIVQGRDITDYKQAQEELRKKEENFRKMIENIFKFVPEGLLVFTDKLNLFRKNEAFQEIVKKYSDRLNYTEEELTKIIIEEVKSRITKGDHTEIRIGKKQG